LGVTGVATFSAGTAALPAITTTGDTNTGIFFPAADTIAFSEGGAEAMRIDSSGNVLIGSSTANAKLYSYATSGTTTTIGRFEAAIGSYTGTSLIAANTLGSSSTYNLFSCITDSDGDGGGPFTQFLVRGDGNVGIGTASPLNLGGVNLQVENSTIGSVVWSNGTYIGQLLASAAAEVTMGSRSNHSLRLCTNDTERARITSSGDLFVGTTSNFSADKLCLNFTSAQNGLGIRDDSNSSGATYAVFRNSANGIIGSITRVTTTDAVTYNTTSDQRLKSNIADASPVLDKLMAVKVRQFDWIEGNLHQDYGFIAQELEPTLTGIVTKGETEEDVWQLDYSRIAPHLVKAIQEQQALITALTARITALESI
jgi:hypothetical protein